MSNPVVLFINTRTSRLEAEPCFAAAIRLGLNVVLLTDLQSHFASDWTSETITVDTYDFTALVEAATDVTRRHDVVGVVCWGDRDVEGVAAVAEALALPGNTPKSAATCRNKSRLRLALSEAEPAVTPRYARITSEDELTSALPHVGFPAIMKPAGASASKGIFAVNSNEEAKHAYRELMAFSTPANDPIFRHYPAELLLEQRIDGNEFSVEGIVQGGVVTSCAVTDKYVQEPFFVEYLQLHPTAQLHREEQIILDAAKRVVKVAGLTTGAFHAEFRVTETGQPVVIELNGRTGGGYITSHLINMSRGYDFIEQTLIAVCDLGPVRPMDAPFCIAGSRQVLSSGTGTLIEVGRIDRALGITGVISYSPDLPLGQLVSQPPINYTNSTIGSLLARGLTHESVVNALAAAESVLDIRLQS